MELTTIGKIMDAADRAYKDVPVPEWGGAVRIQEWSAKDLDWWESECSRRRLPQDKVDMSGLRVAVVGRSAVDGVGRPMFQNGQLEKLEEKNAKVVHRLYDEVLKFNRIGEKAIEAEEKN